MNEAEAAEKNLPADHYAVFRLRDFRLYLTGRLFAVIGQQMLTVAVGWELYERTHSPLALGLVGLAEMIAMVCCTLPAGHLADNLNRKRIILTALLVKFQREPWPRADFLAARERELDLRLPVHGGGGADVFVAGQFRVSHQPRAARTVSARRHLEQRRVPAFLRGRPGARRRAHRGAEKIIPTIRRRSSTSSTSARR